MDRIAVIPAHGHSAGMETELHMRSSVYIVQKTVSRKVVCFIAGETLRVMKSLPAQFFDIRI